MGPWALGPLGPWGMEHKTFSRKNMAETFGIFSKLGNSSGDCPHFLFPQRLGVAFCSYDSVGC